MSQPEPNLDFPRTLHQFEMLGQLSRTTSSRASTLAMLPLLGQIWSHAPHISPVGLRRTPEIRTFQPVRPWRRLRRSTHLRQEFPTSSDLAIAVAPKGSPAMKDCVSPRQRPPTRLHQLTEACYLRRLRL